MDRRADLGNRVVGPALDEELAPLVDLRRQERVGEFETPTDGYAVLNLSAGTRLTLGGRLNVLTVSLDNTTDTVYRNHLSRVKAIMPEAGRGLSVTYRVVF